MLHIFINNVRILNIFQTLFCLKKSQYVDILKLRVLEYYHIYEFKIQYIESIEY